MRVPPEGKESEEKTLQGAAKTHLTDKSQHRGQKQERAGAKSGGQYHAAVPPWLWVLTLQMQQNETPDRRPVWPRTGRFSHLNVGSGG
ncbi:MAG TPA: hypothetical protein VG055_22305 [Planctomycetaceae bacterium]|jgi:hypothetical protein|nr:hypothetical protein [Planctomycetaceae bacterium]